MRMHILEHFVNDIHSKNVIGNKDLGPTCITESIESSDPDFFYSDTVEFNNILVNEEYCNNNDTDVLLLV